MNSELPPFPNLRNAILNLEKCLNCTYCYRVFTDPYTLTTCGHTFCKHCITLFVSAHQANCPLCDLPNWLNQSQPNRQLKALLQNFEKLRYLLAIPNPNTPVLTRIQPRVEKKRKRKKVDLFNESTTKTIEEEEPNVVYVTPSLVINLNNENVLHNTEQINLHCAESLVQNRQDTHSLDSETRSLPNGLAACIKQIDNDELPRSDTTTTRTQSLEEYLTLETSDMLPRITIPPSFLVLSQEIDLNGLNLAQTNSQEISPNQDTLSKSDYLQKDSRLASQQNTPQSSFIGKFGEPIPFQISQLNSPSIQSISRQGGNSPFIQQSYSSPNLSTLVGKQLSSQQQAFEPPITKQKNVTPSYHTPNNTHIHNVIHTNTPSSCSCKQDSSVFLSGKNVLNEIQESFLDLKHLTSTPERLNNSPTADYTSKHLTATSPVHNPILLVTPEEEENLTTVQLMSIDHTNTFIDSQSQSPDLLNGFSSQIPELIQPPAVQSVESKVDQPNECYSIPNSPTTAILHFDSQKNHILTSQVKESGNFSNPPLQSPSRSNNQDDITSSSPITDKTGTPTDFPLHISLLCPQEYLSTVIESCEDTSNNISHIPTAPISHNSPVIEERCTIPHTTHAPTSIPTPEYQQPSNTNAELSILIEEDSMPEKPTGHTGQVTHQFAADILTIVIPDDSPEKPAEDKKDPHISGQLYPKKIHSNLSSKMNIHDNIPPTTNAHSMGDFFNHFHHSQPSSKPQFSIPTSKTNLAVLNRSTSFQKFDTFNSSQFTYFPQTLPINSHTSTSKLKAFPDQIPKDCDSLFNLMQNQTQEEQRLVRKCSSDNQNPFQENISCVSGGSQPLPTPPNTNKQDIFSNVFHSEDTPNDVDNDFKETLLSTEDKVNNTLVNNNNSLPGENDEIEILLTPVSIPNFDSSIVTEQETCVTENLITISESNREEGEDKDICYSQPADSVDNAQTNTSMVATPERISSPLMHVESEVADNGDVPELNDGDMTPTNRITKSQSDHISVPSLITPPPQNEIDRIDVDSTTAMLVSPSTSPQVKTSAVKPERLLPYNSEKFNVFDIKDSPANPSLHSPKQHTTFTSPTKLFRFPTLQPHTPNHKYVNTQPQNTPPQCSQFSQMNEVLSLARDLENRFSKNETIDSDTDSIFSLTQNSPKPNSNTYISYLSLTPKTHTFPTPPSVAKELVQGMERFNSPLGVSIFDYADMGIDENMNIIPHFSPSIGSPPTLNPIKRRANTFRSKKLKLESYKRVEQQASRILSPKKANEISNFSNRPFRNRGKSRYKHDRQFQAN